MEKIKVLLWIVLGLGLFVWRLIQKARETSRREQQERRLARPGGAPRPAAPGLPATTFEQMLRQMQAENQAPPPAPARPPLLAEPEAARSLEQPVPAPQVPKPQMPEPQPEAHSLEVPLHEARRATDLLRASNRPATSDYWTRQQARAAQPPRPGIPALLQEPANLRAAFVLSEILKTKF